MGTTFKRLAANLSIGSKKALSKKQADFLEKNNLHIPFSKARASKIIEEFKAKSSQREWFLEQAVQKDLSAERQRMQKIEKEILIEKRKRMEEELRKIREGNDKEKAAGMEKCR